MNRIPVVTTYILALLVLAAMTGLVGCSKGDGGNNPAMPDITANSAPPPSPSGDGVTLGYFQFVFDNNVVTVEEASPVRGAEFNVTPFATIIIDDFSFDEPSRNWYVTATLKNISPYTGYDVWAVFHSLGNKFVVNQDGFYWALPPIFPEPTRVPFIAYGKNQPDRVFPPMYQDTRTVVIHQPEGIPKLAPIGFWIDATIHPRQTPGIEDLAVNLSPDTGVYTLTGFVWDHQSPSADLTVYADTSNFNGNNHEPMYDDGQHGDGAAGDDIFGAFFSGDAPDGHYMLTVYAFDPDQHSGENDVGFWQGEQIPCDLPVAHIPFETIDKGDQSGIQNHEEIVINDWATWENVWGSHTGNSDPAPPIPPINFENHTVIGVWLGERPSNNHHVTIHDVVYDPCEDLVTVFYDFTPYTACGPLDVITYPFHIIILPKFDHPAYFVGQEVDCPAPPPDCQEQLPFEPILHGVHSGIHEPYELRITNWDQFMNLWNAHTSNMWPKPPAPEINFELNDLIAVGLGNRPTGGFEAEIFKICYLADQSIGVYYRERIPGPDCPVEQIVTQPFDWVVMPKHQLPIHFFKHEEVYNCGQTGCEEPLMFYPIDEGPHTGHSPGEFVFTNADNFHAFWQAHKPDTQPPQVNFQEQMVLAMLIGERPTTGYYVETVEVCLNGLNDPSGPRIDVTYVENVPGPNCPVEPVVTTPFQIIVIPKFEFPVVFHQVVSFYDCIEPCNAVPSYQVAEGNESCAEPGEYGFQVFGDWFEEIWYDVNCYTGGGNPPIIPEYPGPVQGGEMKPFIIQAEQKPTDGYYYTIDYVCLEGCTASVYYTLWEPGPNCEVNQVTTKPWVMGVAEFPPIDCEIQWNFIGSSALYECPGGCQSVPYMPLADGNESCAEPGQFGWQYFDGYEQFWKDVHCAGQGGEVPPLPPDPDPSPNSVIAHFGIQLPIKPSTGYYISVENVCIEGCDIYVDWTENIPAENCDVVWVETKPWATFAVSLPAVYCAWTWHFNKSEVVYDCNDPCFQFETVAGGPHYTGGEPGGFFFDNYAAFHEHWVQYHLGNPFPSINFNGGWGVYCIHDGTRPTTGFEVEVFEVCPSDDPFGVAVRWTEWIPGETCPVEQVQTQPWTMVTFPLVDMPYFDQGFEEVYQCD